jgi:hypothetical protein
MPYHVSDFYSLCARMCPLNWISYTGWRIKDIDLRKNNPGAARRGAKEFYCRHQIACFKVTAKLYSVVTRTAELRRVKTAQNSQRSKASDAVLLT